MQMKTNAFVIDITVDLYKMTYCMMNHYRTPSRRDGGGETIIVTAIYAWSFNKDSARARNSRRFICLVEL